LFLHEGRVFEYVLEAVSVAILFHFFEFISISGANEIALHIIDVSIGVHQILLVLSLDLDAAHYHVIFDVNALFFFVGASLQVLDSPG
jgi:hypothetical protein